jgi:hypothetical protein
LEGKRERERERERVIFANEPDVSFLGGSFQPKEISRAALAGVPVCAIRLAPLLVTRMDRHSQAL